MRNETKHWTRGVAVRRLMNFTALAGILGLLLFGFNLPSVSPASTFSLHITTTRTLLQNLGNTTWMILYFHNGLPWSSTVGPLREKNGNTVTVTKIDVHATINGSVPLFSFTRTASTNQQFSLLSPNTVNRTITSSGSAGRWQPVVLPGETAAIWYIGWEVGCGEPKGTHVWTFKAHFQVLGNPTESTLAGSAKFNVTQSFPACVEGRVSDNGNGVGINGAQVSLVDLTAGVTAQVWLTSPDGSYFFGSSSMINGHSYQVKVTALPAPYTSATELPDGDPQPFTWTGSIVFVPFAAS